MHTFLHVLGFGVFLKPHLVVAVILLSIASNNNATQLLSYEPWLWSKNIQWTGNQSIWSRDGLISQILFNSGPPFGLRKLYNLLPKADERNAFFATSQVSSTRRVGAAGVRLRGLVLEAPFSLSCFPTIKGVTNRLKWGKNSMCDGYACSRKPIASILQPESLQEVVHVHRTRISMQTSGSKRSRPSHTSSHHYSSLTVSFLTEIPMPPLTHLYEKKKNMT